MVAAVSPTDPMNERGSHVLMSHLGFKEGAKLDRVVVQESRGRSSPDGFTLEVRPPGSMHTKQTCSHEREPSPLDSGETNSPSA